MGGCQQEGPVQDLEGLGTGAPRTVYVTLVKTGCSLRPGLVEVRRPSCWRPPIAGKEPQNAETNLRSQ